MSRKLGLPLLGVHQIRANVRTRQQTVDNGGVVGELYAIIEIFTASIGADPPDVRYSIALRCGSALL
jgi:hypothetical protein